MRWSGGCLLLLLACVARAHATKIVVEKVLVDFGGNIGTHVASRIFALLSLVAAVEKYDPVLHRPDAVEFESGSIVLAFGNSTISGAAIDAEELKALGSEGFVIKSSTHGGLPSLVVNGNPMVVHTTMSLDVNLVHIGAVLGSYALLEELGFGFLHPLKSSVPPKLTLQTQDIHRAEKPAWAMRGFHIHTQHPLEVTEVLQGVDIPMFGPHGPECKSGRTFNTPGHEYCERWEDMVDEVDRMFEWMVANRLNLVEWLLLGNYKWGDFDASDIRQKRLHVLTDLGHMYGLMVFADVPIAERQQHAWYMIDTRTSFEQQVKDIQSRIDWVFSAGFDGLATQSGLSEFTRPDCQLMLDLMNACADYANVTWGREVAVKVHCSTGQVCEDFPDLRTGEAVNFNMLPTHASRNMGVMAHTVQAYALDDPTAGSYGNDNFTYMFDYMFYEAHQRNRTVLWYPETAYWVNVDIDVPLFLPIYGHRRLHDLRLIAAREARENVKINGQINFDSGWEWGYWLSDVITARASWDPMMDIPDETQAFKRTLEPFTRLLPDDLATRVADFIADLVEVQSELLIHGRVDGKDSPNLNKLSGFAYMSGDDAWVDLPRLFGIPLTQPDKVHIEEVDDEWFPYVLPLLRAMETAFGEAADRIEKIHEDARKANNVSPAMLELIEELDDSTRMLAYRATLVRIVYTSRTPGTEEATQAGLLASGRALIGQAELIVRRREANYRVPWQRVGGWRDNPTVYRYGYLWSVHSLFFWWRDQGSAEAGSLEAELSPCYLNRIDPTETAIGWGKAALEAVRVAVNRYSPHAHADLVANCFSSPPREYEFPRDLYVHKVL